MREVEEVEHRIGVRIARRKRRQLEFGLDEPRDARVIVLGVANVRALRVRRDDRERDAHAERVEAARRIAAREDRRLRVGWTRGRRRSRRRNRPSSRRSPHGAPPTSCAPCLGSSDAARAGTGARRRARPCSTCCRAPIRCRCDPRISRGGRSTSRTIGSLEPRRRCSLSGCRCRPASSCRGSRRASRRAQTCRMHAMPTRPYRRDVAPYGPTRSASAGACRRRA